MAIHGFKQGEIADPMGKQFSMEKPLGEKESRAMVFNVVTL